MPNEPDALRLETVAAQRARDENLFSRMAEGGMVLPIVGVIILIAVAAGLWLAFSARKKAPALAVAGPAGFSAVPAASIPLSPGSRGWTAAASSQSPAARNRRG